MRRRNLETQKGPRDAHAQRKDNVRTQQEDGHLQAKGEASNKTKAANTLISYLEPPEL